MKIQLVSFHLNKRFDKAEEISSIINSSDTDLILFSGWSINKTEDINKIKIVNDKSVAVFEAKKGRVTPYSTFKHELFCIKNRKITPLYSNQQFSTSKEADSNREVILNLLHELEHHRRIIIGNKECLILQCGELAILKNLQSQSNKVVFRYQNEDELNRRFEEIIERADCILNPMHSIMGEQGKLEMRRKFFSKNGKAYFSVANAYMGNFYDKRVHYAYLDGESLPRNIGIISSQDRSCSWIYEI